jgi:hypothetical protein
MSKKLYTIIIALALNISAFAQTPTLHWAKGFGGVLNEEGIDIVADNLGNVYTTGLFTGTVDFDPGVNSYSITNPFGPNSHGAFIQKLDPLGNFIWAKAMTGNVNSPMGSKSYPNAITLDNNGNIYITGWFNGEIDFNPDSAGMNILSGSSSFILKLNSQGNFVWVKEIGGGGSYGGKDIALDSTGNIIVIGNFGGQVDFDPGIGTHYMNSGGSYDTYILKLDTAGSFIWAKQYGTSIDDLCYNLGLDNFENIYFTGHSQGAPGGQDYFLVKLDSLGNTIWTMNIDDGINNLIGGILCPLSIDHLGNSIIAGYFNGTTDFDPGPPVFNLTGNASTFILKLNPNGNFIWAKKVDGPVSSITVTSIASDVQNNIYFTGDFAGTIDFDPNAATNNVSSNINIQDVFILKLNESGNFDIVTTFGGNDFDGANSIFLDSNKYIYTTGAFYGTTDLNPDTTNLSFVSNGYNDAFIQKLRQCSNTISTINPVSCELYISPLGQTITTSGIYTEVIPNIEGCDSTITINLTIHNNTTSSITQSSCDSIVVNNQTYYNSGVYSQTIQNSNGCDSLITIDVTVNPSPTAPLISTIGNTTFCDGDSIMLIGNNGGIWSNNSTAADIIVLQSGSYYVTASNTCGTDTSNVLDVIVNPLPTAPIISAIGGTSFCDGDSLMLTGNNGGVWSNNSTTVEITVLQSGSYYVTASNTCGTDTSNVIDVTVNPLPNLSVNVSANPVCMGSEVSLTANGAGNIVWGGSVQNGIPFIPAGTATYMATVTDTNGCSDTISATVIVNPLPIVSLVQGVGMLTANATGAAYQWLDCDNGFAAIAGETNQSFTPTVSGNYAALITENGCTDTSACFNVLVVGLSANNNTSNIHIYPNPANDILTIQTTKPLLIEIYSLEGNLIESRKVNGNNSFGIGNYANGMSLIKAIDNIGGFSYHKLVKQ